MPRNMDAINTPVNKPGKEIHTGDMKIGQRDSISLSLGEKDDPAERDGDTIVAFDSPTDTAYIDTIAFGEEPIRIRIERSNEKNAPRFVPCWVNGRGAEVFSNGKWITLGALPLGEPIITRRKYVEVIAAAKIDSVDTKPPTPSDILEGKNDQNQVDVVTAGRYPFSVLEDANPKGQEWLNKIMYLRA